MRRSAGMMTCCFGALFVALFVALFGAVIAVAFVGQGVARAEPASTDPTVAQSQLEQCLGDSTIGVDPPPSCTFDPTGKLIGRSDSSPGGSGSMPNLAPIIFLLLLWSAVPFAIAAGIARSRGEPVGTAVLLTLVLGWVGLLIVLYGQRRAVDEIAGLSSRSVSTATSAARRETPSARLARIEDLHARGQITDAERAERRTAILDEL